MATTRGPKMRQAAMPVKTPGADKLRRQILQQQQLVGPAGEPETGELMPSRRSAGSIGRAIRYLNAGSSAGKPRE